MSRRLALMIFTLLLSAVGFTVSGQRVYEPHFSFGVHGGMTMGKMSFSPSVKQGWATGFEAGAVVRYTEENHFGIIAELNIAQRGWKEDFEEYNSDFAYRRTLTYIQLPLLTHIYFGSPRKLRGFVNAGPVVGYMIGSSITANFDYHSKEVLSQPTFRNRSIEQLRMGISNKFDYGIAVGLGMEKAIMGAQSIMLEGRFYYGLGNIFPCAKKDYFSAARGMAIEVMLGWMFNR